MNGLAIKAPRNNIFIINSLNYANSNLLSHNWLENYWALIFSVFLPLGQNDINWIIIMQIIEEGFVIDFVAEKLRKNDWTKDL